MAPFAFARVTCGKAQTQSFENREEKSSTGEGLEETPLNRSVPQTQGVYVLTPPKAPQTLVQRGWGVSCDVSALGEGLENVFYLWRSFQN